MTYRKCVTLPTIGLTLTLLTAAACGSNGGSSSNSPTTATSTTSSNAPVPVESNPPGDIPDNLAFVPYESTAGHYAFTHPEGWAQTVNGPTVKFTDKLNGVIVTTKPGSNAPTVASAKSSDVARLKAGVPAFELKTIEGVTLPAGPGVRIVFRRNSDPDAVTGKIYRDEVEEYLVLVGDNIVQMDLYGPVGADNVDAYRTMSQSLSSK